MKNEKIIKIATVTSHYVDSFEEKMNQQIESLVKNGKEVKDITVLSKNEALVGIIYYKEYLDEIENLPDVIE